MKTKLITLCLIVFLISFTSASWVQKENIKYDTLQIDENVEIEYDLKHNEFSFNLTTPTKFDLALCIDDNSNIEFDRNKDGIFEEVKEKEVKFMDGWCNELDNFGYGKQDEDPNKAKYRIRFLDYMSPFKIFAGTGTLISKISIFDFNYFENDETDEIKFESENLINVRSVIEFKT